MLATGQTSLKSVDEKASGAHGFYLADLFGVSFVGWQGVAPLHSIIMPTSDGGVLESPIEVADSRAIIVRRLPGTCELGTWQMTMAVLPMLMNTTPLWCCRGA